MPTPANASCSMMLCISAAYADMRCLSVCLSVTFVDHVRTNKHIFKMFSPLGSHTILVFHTKWGGDIAMATPALERGCECRWGIGRNRDSGLIAVYRRLLDVRSAENIYRRWSWVYDTVGHAPLAIDQLLDVRTAKWQKQLPTTMQCRSHSRLCTIDQYAEEKRTEKNLIVRSGISEADTTNNKRLRSTFCIEAIQTRSIVRPLCDSRASCTKSRGNAECRKNFVREKWHKSSLPRWRCL